MYEGKSDADEDVWFYSRGQNEDMQYRAKYMMVRDGRKKAIVCLMIWPADGDFHDYDHIGATKYVGPADEQAQWQQLLQDLKDLPRM